MSYLALASYGTPTLSANSIVYSDGSAQVTAQPTLDFTTFAQNWTQTSAPSGAGQGWVALAMSATGQFQTAATQGQNSQGQGIYLSNNFGQTWTALTSYSYNGTGPGAYPSGTSATSAWYCAGMSASGKYQAIVTTGTGNLYVSSNYGVTWAAASGAATNQNYQCVYLSSTGQYQLACYLGGLLYVSNNYGASWSTTASALQANAVAVSATGQYMAVSVNGGTIVTSNTYGQSWTSTTAPTGAWTAVAVSASGQYMSATLGAPGTIYYSINYGTNWTQATWAITAQNTAYASNYWNNIFVTSGGQYQLATANVLTANLVFYYRFNLTDQTSTTVYNGATGLYDATLYGSASISSANYKNSTGSLSLTATSSQYLKLPTFQMTSGIAATGITLSCWLNLQTGTNSYAAIFELAQALKVANAITGAGTAYTLACEYSNSTLQFSLLSNTSAGVSAQVAYGNLSIPYTLSSTGWTHIAWVLGTSSWTIYVNGAVATPSVVTAVSVYLPPITYTPSGYSAGAYPFVYLGSNTYGNPNAYVTGFLNDFRMYTTTLTATQVVQLYNSNSCLAYSTNFGQNWQTVSSSLNWSDVTVSSNGQYAVATTYGTQGVYQSTTSQPGFSASGNVGIGTNAPLQRLHVYQDGNSAQNEGGTHSMIIHSNTGTPSNQMMMLLDADYTNQCCGVQSIITGVRVWNLSLNPRGGNVGIGITNPTAGLHIKNATSAMRITGNLTNASTRPAVSTTPGPYEIRASSSGGDGSDDGFLRLSAGGGSGTTTQSYIDLSGYSTVGDMTQNIIFGTTGAERMRITVGGNVGIGLTNPTSTLHLAPGATSNLGGVLSINYTDTGITAANMASYNLGANGNVTGTGPYTFTINSGVSSAYTQIARGLMIGAYYKVSITCNSSSTTPTISIGDNVSVTLLTSTAITSSSTTYTSSTLGISATSLYLSFASTPNASMTISAITVTRLDTTTMGNVGIGTNAPLQRLHVIGTPYGGTLAAHNDIEWGDFSNITYSAMGALGTSQTSYGSGAMYLYQNGNTSTPAVKIAAGASDYTYFNGGGNVGIGTNAPATTLHVVGSSSISTPAVVSFTNNGSGQNTSGSGTVFSQITLGAYGPYIRCVQPNGSWTDNVRLDLCTNAGGNDATPVPRISMLSGVSGGYVGIGTTAPGYTLDVNGTMRATSVINSTPAYYIGYTATTPTIYQSNGTNNTSGTLYAGVYNYVAFPTNTQTPSGFITTTGGKYTVAYNGIYAITFTTATANSNNGQLETFISKNQYNNATDLNTPGTGTMASSYHPASTSQWCISWTGYLSTSDFFCVGFFTAATTGALSLRTTLSVALVNRSG